MVRYRVWVVPRVSIFRGRGSGVSCRVVGGVRIGSVLARGWGVGTGVRLRRLGDRRVRSVLLLRGLVYRGVGLGWGWGVVRDLERVVGRGRGVGLVLSRRLEGVCSRWGWVGPTLGLGRCRGPCRGSGCRRWCRGLVEPWGLGRGGLVKGSDEFPGQGVFEEVGQVFYRRRCRRLKGGISCRGRGTHVTGLVEGVRGRGAGGLRSSRSEAMAGWGVASPGWGRAAGEAVVLSGGGGNGSRFTECAL